MASGRHASTSQTTNDDKRQLHALAHQTLPILGRRGGQIWGIFAHPPRGQPSQGSVCRVVEFAPGGAKFMHRTETLDYAICLKGECDLELDDGRTVPMKAGDICVQRGTMHAWVAKGSEPVVFAFVLIDAEPVEKGGKKLTTHYPTR